MSLLIPDGVHATTERAATVFRAELTSFPSVKTAREMVIGAGGSSTILAVSANKVEISAVCYPRLFEASCSVQNVQHGLYPSSSSALSSRSALCVLVNCR